MNILYRGVAIPIITYGCEAWGMELEKRKRSKNLLTRAQRIALLPMSKAYRTTSTEALCVLTGSIPIDLIISEKMEIQQLKDTNQDTKENRLKIRKRIISEWQNRWDTSTKGRITHKFFPNIGERLDRKNLELDKYTVQFITGHGNFQEKLYKFKLTETEICQICRKNSDSYWHTLIECEFFDTDREHLLFELKNNGLQVTENNCVRKEIWNCFKKTSVNILKRKISITSGNK